MTLALAPDLKLPAELVTESVAILARKRMLRFMLGPWIQKAATLDAERS
jgi:hypothetical protein